MIPKTRAWRSSVNGIELVVWAPSRLLAKLVLNTYYRYWGPKSIWRSTAYDNHPVPKTQIMEIK